MLANLGRVKAKQQIERRDFAGYDHAGIYDLYMVAFEDERIAQQAQTAWLTAYVKDQCNAANSTSR